MNKEYTADILSGIDDRFIEEAAQIRKKKSKAYRFAGIAACMAVAIAAGVLISQSDFITPPPVSTDAETTEAAAGKNTQEDTPVAEIVTEPAIYYEGENTESGGELSIGIAPKWDDRITSDKYPELFLGDTPYSSQRTEISSENIGEFIADSEMTGYDIYEDKTYTIAAKVFAVKNISTDCAVAVKIGDENTYNVYVNVWYEPKNLGAFISDLDLYNTVSFGKAYIDIYEYTELATSHTEIIYADFDDSVIWKLLSDCLGAENVEYNHPYDRIGIETNLPLFGYKNISFCITPDGYVITNILSTQKCFFVGTDKFGELDRYLKENVAFKEHSYVNENRDGTVPGKGEAGETTPGYNPDEPEMVVPGYNPETDAAPPTGAGASVSDYPADIIVEETTRIN